MRKIIIFILALAMALCLFGCGAKKTLHCDGCGCEVRVKASSNMEEDWIIFCGDCEEELFGDEPVVVPG